MEMIERKTGLMGMDLLKKHHHRGVMRKRIDVIKSRTTVDCIGHGHSHWKYGVSVG
jgi:hypothetical protein